LVKYIRNFAKRVRKKDSSIVLASHNIEDFLQNDISELTKPIFSIPTYRFLFYPGVLDTKNYMEVMNITPSEFKLIHKPNRGNCLFASGTNRFNLNVFAPDYKKTLFGSGGGR
jgi:type IV secretory pathway VirB4 component